MDIGKIVQALVDRPLQSEENHSLINRRKEIRSLELLIKYQPFGIFGISGETGIGKTTVLNVLDSGDIKKLSVSLIHRDNRETILYDLLFSLSNLLKKDSTGKVSAIAKETEEWIVEQVSIIKGASLGFSLFGSGGGSIEKQKIPRFNVFAAHEKLRTLLETLVMNYGKVLLVIDELDKESKQDVINVLDSLKLELQQDKLMVLFSLPYGIYRDYRQDRMKWNESGNLENVIKDVVFLSELTDSDIRELLLKRLGNLTSWFRPESLEPIVSFADGNPRDALWIAQKVVFDNAGAKFLSESDANESVKKIVREYMGDLALTEIQRKTLKVASDFSGNKEELLDLLKSNAIKRTTSYSTIERLTTLGLLIERNGTYRISGKAKVFLNTSQRKLSEQSGI